LAHTFAASNLASERLRSDVAVHYASRTPGSDRSERSGPSRGGTDPNWPILLRPASRARGSRATIALLEATGETDTAHRDSSRSRVTATRADRRARRRTRVRIDRRTRARSRGWIGPRTWSGTPRGPAPNSASGRGVGNG